MSGETGAIAGLFWGERGSDCGVELLVGEVGVAVIAIVDTAAFALGSSCVLSSRDPPRMAKPAVTTATSGVLRLALRGSEIG